MTKREIITGIALAALLLPAGSGIFAQEGGIQVFDPFGGIEDGRGLRFTLEGAALLVSGKTAPAGTGGYIIQSAEDLEFSGKSRLILKVSGIGESDVFDMSKLLKLELNNIPQRTITPGMRNRNTDYIDTVLEAALYCYFQVVVDRLPPEAEAILPHSNPRLVDRQLGAAVFQEMQVLRFLGNTDAVGRHESIINFITDRGNVTRADIENFMAQGIVAAVNKQFKDTLLSPNEIWRCSECIFLYTFVIKCEVERCNSHRCFE